VTCRQIGAAVCSVPSNEWVTSLLSTTTGGKTEKKSMLREQEHASGISGKEPDVPTKKSDDKLSKEKKVRLTNIYRKSIYRIVRYWCICIDVDDVTAGLLKS
jgi:hypothetical protein